MTRSRRKLDHIQHALSTGQSRNAGFDDIKFIHQSLPDSAFSTTSIQTKIGELTLSSPVFINAMTGGGGKETEKLNEQLAIAAREMGLAIAVGSQMAALKDPAERPSFEVVRKTNPNGIIFANLGSEATVSQAKAAVEMIEADALQIHLNVIQELAMPEGDRDFRGAFDRIQAITESLDVPVIVKETGFGMSSETVKKLLRAKVYALDVGGFGGTNFAEIENKRRSVSLEYLNEWGIPTAVSIVEAKKTAPKLPVLASGGIQTSLDMAKALSLGAEAVGMAGVFLHTLVTFGLDRMLAELEAAILDLKTIMTALGAKVPSDLSRSPVMIGGDTFHWLESRGFDPAAYSRRGLK